MWKRINSLIRHDDLDRGLNAEVRFHIEMETEKNIRLGMSPEDARLKALRSFGPMEKHKEETRDARGVSWIETLVADLRYGARALLKHPGYALLAVLTLGLGIGANTAIFSVINGVLLKPLPYEHGDRLVVVQQSAPLSGRRNTGVAIAEYFDYRERAQGRIRRPGRVPPDEFRPDQSRRPGSRQHRRGVGELLRSARHQADPRPHFRR